MFLLRGLLAAGLAALIALCQQSDAPYALAAGGGTVSALDVENNMLDRLRTVKADIAANAAPIVSFKAPAHR